MNSRLKITILAKKCLHVLFALMLAFIIPVRTAAQDYYPVHATVQVLPPYSLYLSDYSNGFRDRLVITLYNRDLQQQTLDCRLRLRISNTSGFCIESRDEVPQRSITVEPNVPLRLTSQDIAPYLQTGNVKQTGTLRNGRLPEGMMTFSVQVVEQHTGRILSPWASGRAWLETKKPPMLVMPEKDETVAFTDPQHILFRWYPQHLGLSGVEYELHIRDMLDNCQNPAAQYDSGVEVFTTKTRQTLYNYSNIDPELIPGHTYAWRVRAVAMDGIDEVGVFDNDGYSETGWFRLVRGCDAPVIDRAEAGYRKLDLGWHGSADDMRYTVQYSTEKENGSYNWTDTTTIDNETTLYGLTPGATYSYRVGALCSATGKPVYSQIGTVQIPNRDSISAANCGIAPVYKELSKERKTDLKVGDRVTVGGDYTMLITELNSKGNGVYGGKGRLTFTWVFFVGLEVTFDDLVVNTDGYQIDGTVNTVYDGTNTNIANLDQLSDGGVNNRESRMSADGRSTLMNFSVPPMPRSDLSEDGGSVVVYDLSGAPHTIEIPSNGNGGQSIPFSLTDIDGNTWRFESCDSVVTDSLTGNQKTVHGIKMTKLDAVSGFSKDKLSDKVKARIAFANGGFYAFDDLRGKYYDRSSKLGKDYLDKSSLGDRTYAPWKLVPMGKTDKVTAALKPEKTDIDISSVRFVDADGHDLESSYDSDNAVWTVSLTAAATEGNYYNVYAVAKPKDGKGSYQTIGKLFVVSYKTTKADIVLLPVEKLHDVDISKLNEQIRDIFAPCGVEVNITESDALVGNTGWDLNGDGKLSLTNDAETDNVKRSAEMKALEDIVKSMPDYDKNALYLVYVPNGSKSADVDVEGNWGRGRQIGYVFEKLEVRTVAHEVGHAFTLQHTFEKQYGGNETRGKTKNLMDYTDGTQLDAFQWEILAHNAPKIVASVADKAEDNWFAGRTWVTPNGVRFTYNKSRTLAPGFENVNGAIWGIVDENGKAYTWSTTKDKYCYSIWDEKHGKYVFVGDGDDYLHISKSNSSKVFFLNPKEGGCGTFYSGDWADKSVSKYYYNNPDFSKLKKEGNVECVSYSAVRLDGELVVDESLKKFSGTTLNRLVEEYCRVHSSPDDDPSIYKKIKFYVTTEEQLNDSTCTKFFEDNLRSELRNNNHVIWMWLTFDVLEDVVIDVASIKLHPEKTLSVILEGKNKNANLFSEDFENDVNKRPWAILPIALYYVSDWLSNILEDFKIDEKTWNICEYPQNSKTRFILQYLQGTKLAKVSRIIIPEDFAEDVEKVLIPFMCGAWDGIVDNFKGLPDVVGLFTGVFSKNKNQETIQKVHALSQQFQTFCDLEIVNEGDTVQKNDVFGKLKFLIEMLYAKANTCNVSYNVGNLVVPIVAGNSNYILKKFAFSGSLCKGLNLAFKAYDFFGEWGDILNLAGKGWGLGKRFLAKEKKFQLLLSKGDIEVDIMNHVQNVVENADVDKKVLDDLKKYIKIVGKINHKITGKLKKQTVEEIENIFAHYGEKIINKEMKEKILNKVDNAIGTFGEGEVKNNVLNAIKQRLKKGGKGMSLADIIASDKIIKEYVTKVTDKIRDKTEKEITKAILEKAFVDMIKSQISQQMNIDIRDGEISPYVDNYYDDSIGSYVMGDSKGQGVYFKDILNSAFKKIITENIVKSYNNNEVKFKSDFEEKINTVFGALDENLVIDPNLQLSKDTVNAFFAEVKKIDKDKVKDKIIKIGEYVIGVFNDKIK